MGCATSCALALFIALPAAAAQTPQVERPTVPIERPGAQVVLPAAKLQPDLKQLAAAFVMEHRGEVAEWQDARISGESYPIYRPDIEGVAYYEFPVIAGPGVAAGYVLLSTGPHDNPVLHWSTRGQSHVQRLTAKTPKALQRALRYYLLDIFTFAAEDSAGNLVAQLGDPRVSAKAPSWSQFKQGYTKTYSDKIRAQYEYAKGDWQEQVRPRGLFTCEDWHEYRAGTGADQRRYYQIAAGTPPNNDSCASGCGPTAWAMLFGWADYRASQNDPVWREAWNLYGGASAAPAVMDAGVANMTWQLRGYLQTACASWTDGDAVTWPWNMQHARQWTYGKSNTIARLSVDHSSMGIPPPTDSLRDMADDAIRAGKPVILGLGWEHYALAWGYKKKICDQRRDKHYFLVNNGDGTDYWSNAGTWFVAQIYPCSGGVVCSSGKKCCKSGPDACGKCINSAQCIPSGNGCCDLSVRKCCAPMPGGGCMQGHCIPKDRHCP